MRLWSHSRSLCREEHPPTQDRLHQRARHTSNTPKGIGIVAMSQTMQETKKRQSNSQSWLTSRRPRWHRSLLPRHWVRKCKNLGRKRMPLGKCRKRAASPHRNSNTQKKGNSRHPSCAASPTRWPCGRGPRKKILTIKSWRFPCLPRQKEGKPRERIQEWVWREKGTRNLCGFPCAFQGRLVVLGNLCHFLPHFQFGKSGWTKQLHTPVNTCLKRMCSFGVLPYQPQWRRSRQRFDVVGSKFCDSFLQRCSSTFYCPPISCLARILGFYRSQPAS